MKAGPETHFNFNLLTDLLSLSLSPSCRDCIFRWVSFSLGKTPTGEFILVDSQFSSCCWLQRQNGYHWEDQRNWVRDGSDSEKQSHRFLLFPLFTLFNFNFLTTPKNVIFLVRCSFNYPFILYIFEITLSYKFSWLSMD